MSEESKKPSRRGGLIAYRDAGGAEIGRERFELLHHPGGHILRAVCEMDDIGLIRDVSLAMDLDWRPQDAFCRIIRDGVSEASTWFAVRPGMVLCEGVGASGRLSTQLPIEAPLDYLGLHPLAGDALTTRLRDHTNPGTFQRVEAMTNSVSPNGDEAPSLVHVAIDIAYMGAATVEVTAGVFSTHHFRLRWSEAWPPADIWVHGQDSLFVKMQWSMIDNWYELAALDQADDSALPPLDA